MPGTNTETSKKAQNSDIAGYFWCPGYMPPPPLNVVSELSLKTTTKIMINFENPTILSVLPYHRGFLKNTEKTREQGNFDVPDI